ncbi:MAG: class I SAM-dependent methyltransferase [Planctomycetaceae bacterium]|nr:class I SAM-dependent methyltransferase [Planctomycetaceae bacterium]MBV8313804.1 class I SAM-dependent methyltransferase [Planctomycetaceae bacterium]
MVPTLEYRALNRPVFDAIPTSARRILDLGCGTGSLGRAVKARQMTEVTGVTYSTTEADEARLHLDRVIVSDLNTYNPIDLGQFDCIVCSHVLEHLYWPAELLRSMYPVLDPGGRLVVALPNPLVWRQRVRFLCGQFRYTDGGLMDSTHFRFFDWSTARALVTGAGFREVSADADGGFPLARLLPGIGGWLSQAAVRVAPGLFGWQFVIIAEPFTERAA